MKKKEKMARHAKSSKVERRRESARELKHAKPERRAKFKMTGRSALAFLLVIALLVGMTGVSAFANSDAQKEEVIYVSTDANGSVRELNAVNIFDCEDFDGSGKVSDYGDYSMVKILEGDADITQSGKKITIDIGSGTENAGDGSGRIYYQGTMKKTEIPWNISIVYYLDGKKISPEDLAGKSGKLKIHFSVTENSEYSKLNSNANGYFDNYALQAAFTLDTEKCEDIKAADATIANVGQDKQLSYIILPDKGIDMYITANVTDFEMDAVSINGVKLNMDIDVDYSALDEKIDEAKDAVKDLDDGTGDALDASEEIYDAASELADKSVELYDGVVELEEGSGDLDSGLGEITAKSSELTDGAYEAFKGICSSAETMLNQKLKENGMSSITLTPTNYETVLDDLLEKLDSSAVYIKAYNSAYSQVTSEVEANADTLYAAAVKQQIAAQKQAAQQQAAGEGQIEQQQATEGETSAAGEDQLTEEQIIAAGVAQLTEEEKAQIRSAAIQQAMASSDVTSQISAAVASASEAAEQVKDLRTQLDDFQKLYEGICDYTDAVQDAKDGSAELDENMGTLLENIEKLKDSVAEFRDKISEFVDGMKELKDGTAEFFDKISEMKDEVHNKITEMIDKIKGKDYLESFVSQKNGSVKSVQFIIKTDAISIDEPSDSSDEEAATAETEPQGFWQKLLALFGI